jgi:hypothetical protein
VRRYAVIDDADDELDDLPLFQPSPATGLSLKLAKHVEDYLNGRTDNTARANRMVRAAQNFKSLFTRNKS